MRRWHAIRNEDIVYKELQCVSISVCSLCRLNSTLFSLHDVSSTCRFHCRVIRRFQYTPFPVLLCYTPFRLHARSTTITVTRGFRYTPFPLPAHSACPREDGGKINHAPQRRAAGNRVCVDGRINDLISATRELVCSKPTHVLVSMHVYLGWQV